MALHLGCWGPVSLSLTPRHCCFPRNRASELWTRDLSPRALPCVAATICSFSQPALVVHAGPGPGLGTKEGARPLSSSELGAGARQGWGPLRTQLCQAFALPPTGAGGSHCLAPFHAPPCHCRPVNTEAATLPSDSSAWFPSG